MNISVYSPLIGNTYIELPEKLKNPMKDLINIKNNDNKCFLWCHTRHLNFVKLTILIMRKLNFLFQKKIIAKLKDKTIFALMCFVMKMD